MAECYFYDFDILTYLVDGLFYSLGLTISFPVFVGETVFALLPTFEFNQYIGMFFATVMNFENYRYSYGRKIKDSKYGDSIIKLPICMEDDGVTPLIDESHIYSDDG